MESRFSPLRAACTMVLIALGMLTLMGRVAYLQTYSRERTIRKAERQQHQDEVLYSRRGSIFDASGLLMAGTVQQMSLFIDPSFMLEEYQGRGGLIEMDKALASIAKYIDLSPFELAQIVGDRTRSRFVRVVDTVDEQTIAAIEKLNIPGVGFAPTNMRVYPMGPIAAHVLGGVGGEGKGLEGLELRFEKLLAGRDGFKRTLKDARRRPIAVNSEDYLPPANGQHLMLTIDANIQMIVEKKLAAACELHGAKRGEFVVMDPLTGEILAMANWPGFNPQNLGDSPPDTRRNRCITDPFEPGSTIKPFIVGPAVQRNLTRFNEVFPIHGATYKSPLRAKPITDVYGYQNLCLWDILVKSSNVGMAMLGERMGKAGVSGALDGMHFGCATGVELPGEDPGLLRPANKWTNSDIISAVQGYSVMVTPLQLARAMAIYANDGRLVTPRIVRGVLDADGSVVSTVAKRPLKDMPQVIDPLTAANVRRVLADVPVRGTAASAGRSKNWNIFGKTGTAHVAASGAYEDRYTASFIGGAPYENPRIVIAIIIHDPDPTKVHYGGTVSAPAARAAIDEILAYLQVPASPSLPVPPPQIANLLWGFDPKVYTSKAWASARE